LVDSAEILDLPAIFLFSPLPVPGLKFIAH
jgi:hypothetical protein